MLTYALIVFAVAALGGLVLASSVLRGKLAPWALSILHALLGATGLVLLLLGVMGGSGAGRAVAALGLLVVAALGGFYLASIHARKAVAPIFTPRHAKGFASQMLAQSELYARKYDGAEGKVFDIGNDMTELAFAVLSDTLFSGEIVTSSNKFADDVDDLLRSMGRVDPMDLLRAPGWVPRVTRIGGLKVLAKFRGIVRDTLFSTLMAG